MTIPKPYKMRIPKKKTERIAPNRLAPITDEGDVPPLSGFWGDVELGSAEEERLLRGLSKLGRKFTPQYVVDTPYSLPGRGKQIDVVLWDFLLPVEVDGAFHRQESSEAQDEVRDAILNDELRPRGFQPIKHVGTEFLSNQIDADRAAEELQ